MARILLCDDEPAMRTLVQQGLERDGHHVTARPSGTEALEALQASPKCFDLLITDIDMPGLDGVALAKAAIQIVPHLAVIIMSGLIEHLEQSKSVGAQRMAAVSKPFTLEQMRQLVHQVLV
jgi:two-component system, cell cycle response regulator CpdR